jgi:hypothetical protein
MQAFIDVQKICRLETKRTFHKEESTIKCLEGIEVAERKLKVSRDPW